MSTPQAAPATVPLSPRRPALPDARYRPWLFAAVRVIGRILTRLILDLRVRDADRLPATGPVLVVGNHRGLLDGPLVAVHTPRAGRFLAKSELFRGWAARGLAWVGQIPVDRGRPDRTALRRGLAVLDAGGVLGVFPEGTRGAGDVEAIQHGVAYFAVHRPGVPIVPVACVGTEAAMPKGARLPRWRTRVDIAFGEPFAVTVRDNPRARSSLAAAAEEIRMQLAGHVRSVEQHRAREGQ